MTRQQRISPFMAFDFTPGIDRDVYSYAPNGREFTLGIYPRLSAGFPDFELKLKCRDGVKAPDRLSTTRGGLRRLELENKIYYVIAFGIAGGLLEVERHLPTEDYQFIGVLADASGKTLRTVIGPGSGMEDFGANFCHFITTWAVFDREAKPLDFKAMTTTIEPVNVEDLTHHFTATVKMPGGGAVSIRKPVSEIRAAGLTPNSSFNFWEFGYAWQVGNRVAFIGGDAFGKYHEQIFENGRLSKEFLSTNFQQTFLSAAASLYA